MARTLSGTTRWRTALVPTLKSLRHTCCRTTGLCRSVTNGAASSESLAWVVRTESSRLDRLTGLNAVLVLAGGQTPDGGLPTWVERRLDASLDIYKLNEGRCPIVCLGGGTPHKAPIIDARGYVVHESTACAEYLLARGVPALHLLKEVSSYDTVGNTYFSMVIHALPARWQRIAVVTSNFHMPRTRSLFEDMYAIAGNDMLGNKDWCDMAFCSVSDEGLFTREVLEARIAKEGASLEQWKRDYSLMGSLKDLHQWLHSTHLCYAVARQHEFGKHVQLDEKLLSSY